MTVTTTTPTITYTEGQNLTVPFGFQETSDLKVYSVTPSGAEILLTETTDYSVEGAGIVSGGTVYLVEAIAEGYSCTIRRNVPLSQPVDLSETGRRTTSAIEQALDRIEMQVQELDRDKLEAASFLEQITDATTAATEAIQAASEAAVEAVQSARAGAIEAIDATIQDALANMAEFVDFRDYYAGPYDGTIDLSIYMEAAIADAKTNKGKRLLLPPGTIGVSRGFDFAGITITGAANFCFNLGAAVDGGGEANQTVIRVLHGSTPFNYLFYADDLFKWAQSNLQNMYLNCESLVGTGLYHIANQSEPAFHRNVIVSNTTSHGFYISNVSNGTCENLLAIECGMVGINIDTISRCKFTNIAADNCENEGIYVTSSSQFTIERLGIFDCVKSHGLINDTALYVKDCNSFAFPGIHITSATTEQVGIIAENCSCGHFTGYLESYHNFDEETELPLAAIFINGTSIGRNYAPRHLYGLRPQWARAQSDSNAVYHYSFGTSNDSLTSGTGTMDGEFVLQSIGTEYRNGRAYRTGLDSSPSGASHSWPKHFPVFNIPTANHVSYWESSAGGIPGTWVVGPSNPP